MLHEEIIPRANDVLRTFQPRTVFYRSRHGRLWLEDTATGAAIYASTRSCSGGLANAYYRMPFGGTGAAAIGQLARWIRGQTRVPLTAWRAWASDAVQLCNLYTVAQLSALGYDDPLRTCCVLCGCNTARVRDWWSRDGVVGPCCVMRDWRRCPGKES